MPFSYPYQERKGIRVVCAEGSLSGFPTLVKISDFKRVGKPLKEPSAHRKGKQKEVSCIRTLGTGTKMKPFKIPDFNRQVHLFF